MNIRHLSLAAGLLLMSGAAVAQTVVITPEQETVVREYVTAHPVEAVEAPSNFELVVGAVVPDIFKPGELAENTLPDKYQYVVIDGRTALIEPETRKVVHIID